MKDRDRFYIRRDVDWSVWDVLERRFYPSSWEAEQLHTKEFLQSLIDESPDLFEGCSIIEQD